MGTLRAKPQKTGLVLRGGGFLGIFEVGGLKVIQDYRIPIAEGVGDSVGSLNGPVFFAENLTTDLLASTWFSIKSPKKVFERTSAGQFLRKLGKAQSLYRIEPLLKLIGDNLSAEKLVAQEKEFFTAVTHLVSREVLHISNHDPEVVSDPIKALLFIAGSCAIPGVLPPVPIHYRGSYQWYVDGAYGRTLPIKKCIEDGCDTVIVIKCHSKKIPAKVYHWWGGGLDFGNATHGESKEDDEITNTREKYPHINLFVIEPEWLPETLTTVSFKKGDFEKAMKEGERIARRELDPLIRYFSDQNTTSTG